MVNDQKEVKDVKNPEKNEEVKIEEKIDTTELVSHEDVKVEAEEQVKETAEIAETEVEVEVVKEETPEEVPIVEEVKEEVEVVKEETPEEVPVVEEVKVEETVEAVEPEAVVEAEETEKTEETPQEEPEAVVEVEETEKTEETSQEEPEAEVVEEAKEETPAEEQPVEEKTEPKADPDDMMTLLNEHFNKFTKGKIVEGEVVSVDERSVLVDIGFKSESAIPIREFSSASVPEAGTKIKVYIDSVEDGSGRLKLSKKKADFYLNLESLQKLKDSNETVTGILRRRVKGGMIVEIENLEAFLPGSQISTKPIPNLDQFIGKEGRFKILKIDEERRNIIVSRKKVLIEEQESKLSDLRGKLVAESELDGEVRNITDYGAFIDLGGIDGLLHITDMSWGHINHPSDMLNIGDKLKVKVLNYDEENDKVSLGLKQLVPHPWENIEAKYPEGTIVAGKVVNIINYGVFVELESGVEGLVHVSEMSWTKKIKHPKQMLKMGDSVKAIVLATSKDERRISLGIKQMEANPWLTIEDRYPIGMELHGKVKTITPFGVFVEIEDEIEGLIHISDISWTKRIYHPKEVFQKNQEVDVKVLSIDKTLHRIALGVKQLTIDPWDNLDEKLPINTEITAKIAKIISKGVLVDVEVEGNIVEGFAPLSHLAIPGLKKTELAFDVGEEIPLKIIELDLENRRLILSVKAYFFAKDNTELQTFIDEHEAKMSQKRELKKIQKEAKPKKKVEAPVEKEPVVEEIKEEVAPEPVVEAEEAPVEAVEEKTEEVTPEPAEEDVKEEVKAEKTVEADETEAVVETEVEVEETEKTEEEPVEAVEEKTEEVTPEPAEEDVKEEVEAEETVEAVEPEAVVETEVEVEETEKTEEEPVEVVEETKETTEEETTKESTKTEKE